jgi:ketol-acid reductoisomerase
MAQIFRDSDASLDPLRGKTIAVLGYGNQGRAQALNLRDSSMRVIVGNADDAYAAQAKTDGFALHTIGDAATRGDIVLSLLPDEVTPAIYRDAIRAGLAKGKTLGFASGYCVCFNQITFPPDINVIMVAPRTIGEEVRESFQRGRGFLSFLDVHQDHDGQAWPITLALAKGIGSLKSFAMQVSFKDETELDLFTEQALVPALSVALTTAVEVLVEAGYPKAAAALEMYLSGEMGDVLHAAARHGWVGQTGLHSPTSRYGTKSRLHRFERPEFKATMQDILAYVRSGKFAEEWSAEQARGYTNFRAMDEAFKKTLFGRVEREVMKEIGLDGDR